MTKLRTTLWEAEPHTLAKHEILGRYLKAWFRILCKYHNRAVYIDGFCGPGEYLGGEPGSPVIALDIAVACEQCNKAQVEFFFIDERQDRTNNLLRVLEDKGHVPSPIVKVWHGDFAVRISPVLDTIPDIERRKIPLFAFLDPFGDCIPLEIVQRILLKPSSEAFIYFNALDAIRNVKNDEERMRLNRAFGTLDYVAPADAGDKKALLDLYRKQLGKSAKHLLRFEMRKSESSEVYSLFFVSNSELGFYKMKEAMWSVANAGEFTYSDAYSENKPALFGSDEPADLATMDLILTRYMDTGKTDCLSIKRMIKYQSFYLEKHWNAAMRRLEKERRLVTHIEQELSPKRRKWFYPEGLIVTIHSAAQGQDVLF